MQIDSLVGRTPVACGLYGGGTTNGSTRVPQCCFGSSAELLSLISGLWKATGTEASSLAKSFGEALYPVLVKKYPAVVQHADNSFASILPVDDHIHVEVLKLYPDVGLP